MCKILLKREHVPLIIIVRIYAHICDCQWWPKKTGRKCVFGWYCILFHCLTQILSRCSGGGQTDLSRSIQNLILIKNTYTYKPFWAIFFSQCYSKRICICTCSYNCLLVWSLFPNFFSNFLLVRIFFKTFYFSFFLFF